MSSTTPRRRALVLALLAALTAALVAAAAPAHAKPGTGRFKVTKGATFAFTIAKGTCTGAPKNLEDYKARAGKKGPGFCFAGMDGPAIDPKCPEGHGPITGAEASIAPMTGLRLSPSGRLHVKAYEFSGNEDEPSGWTELSLTVTGRKASGFYRATTRISIGDDGAPIVCDTGKIAFTATAR